MTLPYTVSALFPTTNPYQPNLKGGAATFVTKLDSNGQILYSTYISGSQGVPFGSVGGQHIAVDSDGSAYIIGNTPSGFPLVNPVRPSFGGGGQDAFILKLSAEGSALIYSTYLGGSGSDLGLSIAVDQAGNAYVCGKTSSTNFPIANPFQAELKGTYSAFIAKVDSAGAKLAYSTYFGGGPSADGAFAITVDDQGKAFVAGETQSTDLSVIAAFQSRYGGGFSDGFFATLNPEGSLLFCSYLGGSAKDSVSGIKVATNGDIYLAGDTSSADFPTLDALQPQLKGSFNAFLARYNPQSNKLIFSTYLGGSTRDEVMGFALDSEDNALVTGSTDSEDFPTTADAVQTSRSGGAHDGFVSVLSSDGKKLIYSTYLGGSGDIDNVQGVALDNAGNVFLAGEASADFPIENPILPYPGAESAGFVLKADLFGNLPPLKIIRSGQTILISWPDSVTSPVLEMTDVLPASTWNAVPITPINIGAEQVIAVDIDSTAKFFRLRQ